MYYFLKDDLDALDKQIAELLTTIKETGQEMGASTQETSETWHDNFGFEDSSRRFAMLSERYRQLTQIRKAAVPVTEKPPGDKVAVGCRVYLEEEDGSLRTIKIGSYFTFADKSAISYNSPIAQIAMGASVGDIVEGNIAGKFRVYTIMKIEIYL
jgi:transcription elongation GreA/GreB family factor